MSPKGKKYSLLAGLLLVLLLAGFAAIQYVEKTVADETRKALAMQAKDVTVRFDNVAYSWLNDELTVTNLQIEYSTDMVLQGKVVAEMVKVGNLNIDGILNKDFDPTGEKGVAVPLCDVLHVQNLTTAATLIHAEDAPLITEASIKNLEVTGLFVDVHQFWDLVTAQNASFWDAGTLALTFSGLNTADTVITLTQQGLSLTVDIAQKQWLNYVKGNLENINLNTIKVTSNAELSTPLTIGNISIDHMRSMDYARYQDFLKLQELDDDPEEAARQLIKFFFSAEKPFVERVLFSNLAWGDAELPLSMASIELSWPSMQPFAMQIAAKNLIIPAILLPESDMLPLLGYKTIDLSTNIDLAWQNKDTMQMGLALDIKDLAKATVLLDSFIPFDALLVDAAKAERDFGFDEPKLQRFSLEMEDLGIVGRGFRTAMLTTSLEPGAIKELLFALTTPFFVEALGQDVGKKTLATFKQFVDAPGKLLFLVEPDQALTMDEVGELTGAESFISLQAVPGPKTLEQVVQEAK